MRRPRAQFHLAHIVLGTVPCCHVNGAQTRWAHGVCRASGDRARSVRAPVLKHLAAKFDWVQVVAIRRKLFPELSEDCWLLYCDGFGGQTGIAWRLSIMETFRFHETPPKAEQMIPLDEWCSWRCRLRPYLLSPTSVRCTGRSCNRPDSLRLRDVARVGIGYVTGANDFFHLRPSEAGRANIPERFLHPTVRNGRCLAGQGNN